jgi:predicted flavoprotein YhiN
LRKASTAKNVKIIVIEKVKFFVRSLKISGDGRCCPAEKER